MPETATVNIPHSGLHSTHNASGTTQSSKGQSSKGQSWHLIDWSKAQRVVKNLQARIVKAVEQGKWKKVRDLQRLLNNSWSAKVLAVLRVTSNKGGKTAGIDGEKWDTPTKKWQAIHQLNSKGYQAQAVRRVKIPKANGKWRPLGIPNMKDRAMQALHLLGLDPVSETMADEHSYGFRPHRSCADAIRQCHTVLYRAQSAEWILEADIKACFDGISHSWLLDNIPMNKKVLKQWLKTGYVEKKQRFDSTKGTPQGSVISPTLANMTLDGLQQLIDQHFNIRRYKGGYRNPKRIHLIRYADDFIITAKHKADLEQLLPVMEGYLKERGLTLSKEKTKLTHINEGFDFLGKHIRKYKGKLLTKPSKKNVQQLLDKVQQIIYKFRSASTYVLIYELNPVLRGWANYHRADASKETYYKVDTQVWKMLWKWALRRHPNKGKRWVRKRYFTTHHNDHWAFFATEPKGRKYFLYKTGKTPIKRHIKIKSSANPYHLNDEAYFEQRNDRKMVDKLRGKKLLRLIYNRQNGICPICKGKISTQTGWNAHHITPMYLGGKTTLDNLVMLHPICHQQVHYQPEGVPATAAWKEFLKR